MRSRRPCGRSCQWRRLYAKAAIAATAAAANAGAREPVRPEQGQQDRCGRRGRAIGAIGETDRRRPGRRLRSASPHRPGRSAGRCSRSPRRRTGRRGRAGRPSRTGRRDRSRRRPPSASIITRFRPSASPSTPPTRSGARGDDRREEQERLDLRSLADGRLDRCQARREDPRGEPGREQGERARDEGRQRARLAIEVGQEGRDRWPSHLRMLAGRLRPASGRVGCPRDRR